MSKNEGRIESTQSLILDWIEKKLFRIQAEWKLGRTWIIELSWDYGRCEKIVYGDMKLLEYNHKENEKNL